MLLLGKKGRGARLRNSLPASGNIGCLQITFANSLDPDQDGQNVSPDLDLKCLTLCMITFLIFFFFFGGGGGGG